MARTKGTTRPPDPTTGRPRDLRARDAILSATVELLGENGYQALTMEGIAARAGVGKATIYRWWPTKASVAIEAITEQLPLSPVRETGDVHADMRSAVRAAIVTLTGQPVGHIIPAVATELIGDPGRTELRRFLEPRRSSVQAILRAAAERGELPDDVDTDLLFGIYAGTILYRHLISGESVTDDLANQLVALLLDGRIPTTTPLDRTATARRPAALSRRPAARSRRSAAQ